MRPVFVRDIERAVAAALPVERAEAWDRVGLLAGDPEAVVTGVTLALDPTVDALHAAADMGANVLVTHHPAYLSPPAPLRPGASGSAAVVYEAVRSGVALINAHTNLDRDARAQRLIPQALGLLPKKPLETQPQPRTLVTVYVPASDAEAVTDAMSKAGAGRIGDYERCSFRSAGTGAFTPPADGAPCVGTPGVPSQAEEVRVEMICARGRAAAVVRAAAKVHPYEEPLVTATEVDIAPNAAALGMLSVPGSSGALSLHELAALVVRSFGVVPRVWGDPDMRVERVASATGSASSLLGAAVANGAHAFVAGEVRYHDALDASKAGLGIVEMGHDVSEWPLVGLLASVVREIDGIDSATVTVLPDAAGWWTP